VIVSLHRRTDARSSARAGRCALSLLVDLRGWR
jgi:hypothetical protein